MNYSTLTETNILERYETLPSKLSDMLFAKETSALIKRIADAHHLDEERTTRLSQLTALIIMGFVSRGALAIELTENLFLNYRHAGEIAEELDEKVFNPIARDLDDVYKPAETLENAWEEKSRTPFWSARGKKEDKIIEDDTIHLATLGDIPENKPLILHEEKKIVEQKPKFSLKSLSGFSFFDKSKKPATYTAPSATARIETPKETSERVVHYNELHAPSMPFDATQNFIDLETFTTTPPTNKQNLPADTQTTSPTLPPKEDGVIPTNTTLENKKWSFNFNFFKPKQSAPSVTHLPVDTEKQTQPPLATLTSPHTEDIQKTPPITIASTPEPTNQTLNNNTIDLRH